MDPLMDEWKLGPRSIAMQLQKMSRRVFWSVPDNIWWEPSKQRNHAFQPQPTPIRASFQSACASTVIFRLNPGRLLPRMSHIAPKQGMMGQTIVLRQGIAASFASLDSGINPAPHPCHVPQNHLKWFFKWFWVAICLANSLDTLKIIEDSAKLNSPAWTGLPPGAFHRCLRGLHDLPCCLRRAKVLVFQNQPWLLQNPQGSTEAQAKLWLG